MKAETKPAPAGAVKTAAVTGTKHPLLWTALLLAIILPILFWQAFRPHYVAFSNDGPYGLQAAECTSMPGIITGLWEDIGWLGNEGISVSPDITSAVISTFPLRAAMNLFYPLALFITGMGVCFFMRQLKLAPLACILAGLAAALNSDFLSTACWGVSPEVNCFGVNYMALGLLAGMTAKRTWVRIILAGLAVGLGIMEGFDNGAYFSLFVAAFALFQSLFLQEGGGVPQKFGRGILRIAVVAVAAALISVHTLSMLVGTQIKGVAGMSQDPETKAAEYAAKTAFSLPPIETLQVIVPGLFGYRNTWHMYDSDQPTTDQYWGSIGTPTGTGEYCGVLVVLVAVWGIFQSFRKRGSPYSILQRRSIWFWTVMLLLCLLLAYGKYLGFYRLFYALPYASTMRNPVKFMHVFCWIMVILFGYGVHGLTLAYLTNPVARVQSWMAQFKKWRAVAQPFERNWMNGCFALIGVSLLGLLLYSAGSNNLEDYLKTLNNGTQDCPAAFAAGIASFSMRAACWGVLFLVLSVGTLALIFSGQFTGARAKWAGILMGAILVVDLGRAGIPWIVFYDMDYKLADDPVVDFLADKPYEHRVAIFPGTKFNNSTNLVLLFNSYGSHWNQHLFPLHNIQCYDVSQEPRVALDKDRFLQSLPNNGLIFELLNVRYFLGQNGKIDPSGKHFRILKTFNFKRKNPNAGPDANTKPADWVTYEDPKGELAVIEYLDALPRAKLYSNWQVYSNDDDVLKQLSNPAFDPHQTVLVSGPAPSPVLAAAAANPPDDAVKITSYKSKRTELDADVKTPSVLFMSERYNDKWRVEVDGQPAEVLRLNFIERGVYLTPGKHHVVFHFRATMGSLYVSIGGVCLGLVLCGWVALTREPEPAEPSAPAAPKSK